LRLEPGSEVEIFDGRGSGYRGIVQLTGREVRIAFLEKLETPPRSDPLLILAPALIRADRFELILQKGTELGVDEFIPLITRYSSVRLSGSHPPGRLDRWRRIIREASKQCRRLTLPVLHDPTPFEELCGTTVAAGYILCKNAPSEWTAPPAGARQIHLCIGPEGGWDSREVAHAEKAAWKFFRLGDTILRSETAAIAAAALVRFGKPTG